MKKIDGMKWDDFEKWVEEKYPFGEIHFDGGRQLALSYRQLVDEYSARFLVALDDFHR